MIYIKSKFTLLLCCFFVVGNVLLFSNLVFGEEINWKELNQQTEGLLQDKPQDPIVRFEFAISLANLGKVEESYEQFEILGKEETREQSRQKIEENIKEITDNKLLKYNYQAFLAVVDKNYEESIEYFKYLIEFNPENVWSYNYLAASYYELGDLEKAKNTLDNALEIKDNSYSHLLYGLIYLEENSYFRAIRSFNRSGQLFNIIAEEVL